jgi:large subunit ribosomal protein L21
MPYAIIETGGKQYRVQPGDTIEVESLPGEPGSTVELDRILLLDDDETLTVGQPTVDGARVVAEIQDHGRGKKIVVFKYKSKTRYQRKQGHRQSYTRLTIREIAAGNSPSTGNERSSDGA